MLISKFMTSQTGKQIIAIHVLPNISRSKGNQKMKSGQLIDTTSLTLTNYPLALHYMPSMCVTSSFQLFPPFTMILTNFSMEVPLS